MKRKGLSQILRNHLESTVELHQQKESRPDIPRIVNVVSTVELFPQGPQYRFPLESIAAQLDGCVQYCPLKFPANIIRLRDRDSDSTALLFRSGKITTAHSLSWEHAQFCCHMFRLMIENVECVMRDPDDDNRLKVTKLAGRTEFANWQIQNAVGFGILNCRLDLRAILDAAPDVCQYKPDSFPGLKLRAWVKPQEECQCEHAALKCQCKVKLLIFDTGRIIITGARSVRDINQVFYRFKAIAPSYVDEKEELPRNERYQARIKSLLEDKNVGAIPQALVEVDDDEEKEDEELLEIMTKTRKKRLKRARTDGSETESTFFRACLEGQEPNVRFMLSINGAQHLEERDDKGKTALERLEEIPEKDRLPAHTNIISMLRQAQT